MSDFLPVIFFRIGHKLYLRLKKSSVFGGEKW